MTVWINNPFDFLPGEGARLQRYGLLAQAFAEAGHKVIWWSSDWDHVEKRGREVAVGSGSWQLGECGNAGMRECANGAPEIRLIRTMPYYQNVGVRRLLSHWRYAKRWEREALRCDPADHPDLIICSAPPLSTGWVMRGLCKHFACKGVVDVMDLWPETFERVAPAWLLWPLRWMARRVYQGADAISAVGDSYLEAVGRQLQSAVAVGSGRGGTVEVGSGSGQSAGGKPMYRCYHGIEMQAKSDKLKAKREEGEEVAVGSSSRQLTTSTSEFQHDRTAPVPHCPLTLPTANLSLVYVGNMGRGYDLETLVRAVVELVNEGVSISLDLAGGGEQEPALKRLAHATPAITFHGVVRGDALGALLEQADAGVVPMFSSTHVAVPYKLADYVAAGLPVVNALAGETARLLDRYGCGWQYEAGSVASLKQALCTVLELKVRDAAAFDARRAKAQQLAEECFDAARIYPAFVRWIIATTKWSQ
jgi:glycosyltransferase involved in cell wall biosynthesis